MDNTESEKRVYYMKERAVFMGVQLQPRSLVASSTPLGPPWVRYDPQRDGVAYFSFDADDRRAALEKSPNDRR